ncbi:MAG: type II toxin-antitoxin system VapC family toxin [Candidatus Ranarchaeia archaeon]
MISVLIDTNILIHQVQNPIDIKGELERIISQNFEIICIPQILKEITILINHSKSNKEINLLRMVEKIAKSYKYVNYETEEKLETDDSIVEFSKRNNVIVLTNDSQLRQKLRKYKIPVIFIRKRRHLEIEGIIEKNY